MGQPRGQGAQGQQPLAMREESLLPVTADPLARDEMDGHGELGGDEVREHFGAEHQQARRARQPRRNLVGLVDVGDVRRPCSEECAALGRAVCLDVDACGLPGQDDLAVEQDVETGGGRPLDAHGACGQCGDTSAAAEHLQLIVRQVLEQEQVSHLVEDDCTACHLAACASCAARAILRRRPPPRGQK